MKVLGFIGGRARRVGRTARGRPVGRSARPAVGGRSGAGRSVVRRHRCKGMQRLMTSCVPTLEGQATVALRRFASAIRLFHAAVPRFAGRISSGGISSPDLMSSRSAYSSSALSLGELRESRASMAIRSRYRDWPTSIRVALPTENWRRTSSCSSITVAARKSSLKHSCEHHSLP